MVEEVRNQFNTIPGLMEGTARPDYRRCVEISTAASISEMVRGGIRASCPTRTLPAVWFGGSTHTQPLSPILHLRSHALLAPPINPLLLSNPSQLFGRSPPASW